MTHKWIFLFVIMACAQTADAKKPQATQSIPSGIYSSVRESKESGDRGGVEFRLYADAKPAYVEAVVCESECNGKGRYYTRPTKKGFVFTWTNPRFPEDSTIEFQVWKDRGAVWLEGTDQRWVREKMKRRNKPLGLLGEYEWATP